MEAKFARVVAVMVELPDVTFGEGRGFGSNALKVGGKLFAFVAASGRFVTKLPAARVAALVGARAGEPFDPGHGRKMKEWLALAPRSTESWELLAREACAFVRSSSGARRSVGARRTSRASSPAASRSARRPRSATR